MIYGLFAFAVAPGVFLAIYFYILDKYEHEPIRKVIISFFLGFLAAFIAIILELYLGKLLLAYFSGFLVQIIRAFIVIGLAEEFSKYLMVILGPYRSPYFNEVMDGIVYTVTVSLGFATLENIFYVIKGGFSVGIFRAILAVPAHAFFSAIMGFYIGKAKFENDPIKKSGYLILSILLASFFHGLYDYILFIKLFYGFAIIPLLIFLFFILKGKVKWAQKDSRIKNRL